MRIAAFNVENLFDRAKVFNDVNPGDENPHQGILDAHAELSGLFEKPVYTSADKERMLVLMDALGILNANESTFVRLRRIRGKIIRRPRDRALAREIVANGRDNWVGWVELKTEPVDEIAMELTARVLFDCEADIIGVVEAENRVVLKNFQTMMSGKFGVIERYANIMLIDGNDRRGIDVALGTTADYPIGWMRSHVNEVKDGLPVFSRDCPEFEVTTPGGDKIVVLVNHFKSKFGGDSPESRGKRRNQAEAVAGYYARLLSEGYDNVAVIGDLNDLPDSAPLGPLRATSLRDVVDHDAFTDFEFRADNGNRGIGTHKLGNDNTKIDYLMLSPALFSRVTNAGLFRKGAWPGSRPQRWEVYPDLTRPHHAASDHHLVFADIDI
ncbi:MAG: endonuclease/exonuclease/phosphatase family protein [Pseudomonadota bacterium]